MKGPVKSCSSALAGGSLGRTKWPDAIAPLRPAVLVESRGQSRPSAQDQFGLEPPPMCEGQWAVTEGLPEALQINQRASSGPLDQIHFKAVAVLHHMRRNSRPVGVSRTALVGGGLSESARRMAVGQLAG